MSAGGTRGLGSERILSSRRFFELFSWELFQVARNLLGSYGNFLVRENLHKIQSP